MDEINKSESTDPHFPHRDTLIMNTFISCLQDDDVNVPNEILKIIIKRFPLEGPEFNPDQKVRLIEAILKLFLLNKNRLSLKIQEYLTGNFQNR